VRTQSTDTRPEVERMLIAAYRRMTPSEKLARVVEMTRAVQQMALARLRTTYPDADDRELQLRLGALWLDRETMVRVFGWDPDVQGL
jgi:hypothetical protein